MTSDGVAVAEKKQKITLKRHHVSDTNLRKVSISTAGLLLMKDNESKDYKLNPLMVDFIRAIRNKYRVYLMTKLTSAVDDDADEKTRMTAMKEEREKAHTVLKQLVNDETIKGEHRLMYNNTEAGEIAQVR